MKKTKYRRSHSKRPLHHIAFWQGMGFLMLIVLIWVDAYYGLATLFFGVDIPPKWMSACALTAVAIVVGFITAANTYLQQKRELSGLIAICSYCRKVRINREAWDHVEKYVTDKTLATFTHVICPECEPKIRAEVEEACAKLRAGDE